MWDKATPCRDALDSFLSFLRGEVAAFVTCAMMVRRYRGGGMSLPASAVVASMGVLADERRCMLGCTGAGPMP